MTSPTMTHADKYPMYIYIETPVDQNAPTVAELPPLATAQAVEAIEPVYKTYGQLWMAHMSREERTSFYLAM